ncbi:MAG: AAA family ATPase [Candidatus Cloacimonetes bacterium]|jgi:hypothetical protein|nr:AAA family ATPase [Candidatus Cloacimonadota bacterium]MCB5286226.1 AAA family ATPase [Candidatus Cloacimonadota bacterium]MCK9183909.1 AAA family ATPase [Candidatus Cloacimonadota bacterium]MCK9584675.1 AAA family ATPase [Candidatus Cloacimonadota bacterium]MDY0228548.1 AAA family ATPase [Candidatus Cloacimonadaceae bacterium]
MFYRQILADLQHWAKSDYRKVLMLRGARQVGKTTVVRMLAQDFDTFIELNLELPADKDVFANFSDITSLYNAILLHKGVKEHKGKILLFIDEVQNSSNALKSLRFFHEEMPELYVIAAGSLLEIYLYQQKLEISVGRIEYKWMYPLSFEEFLLASGADALFELVQKPPLPDYALASLREKFLQYALVGGMPEAVKIWTKENNIVPVQNCLANIHYSYQDDILKYAQSSDQASVLRHIFDTAYAKVGKQISFEGFGHSSFRSQAIKNAFELLTRSSFYTLLYPYTSSILPALPQKTRRPKLLIIDTGILNVQAGISAQYYLEESLNSVYKGQAMENLVGQQLIATASQRGFQLSFWKREARNSSAEVDYVIIYKGKMYPIEVKAGKTGSMKSLFLFMDEAPHDIAVRVHDGNLHWEELESSSGKKFHLLNLPLGLCTQICKYLDAGPTTV